jgi:putative oxidoreductase
MNRDWFRTSAHHPSRSLEIVRIAVALILITHPVYALTHSANIRGFGHILDARGLPIGLTLAWAAILMQAICCLMLLTPKRILSGRLILPGCLGNIVVLGMGILLVHAPRWRTVGLPDGDQQPGAEFSVLLIACLTGVLWASWPRPATRPANEPSSSTGNSISTSRGFALVGCAAPLILSMHPLGALVTATHDPEGLHQLGLYFSSIGYPFGVVLVWTAMFVQIACSVAIVLRRYVVPACLGHIYVLGTGIWLFHAPHWFAIGPVNVVGPGQEGMEYSVLLISCFVSLMLAYWPGSPDRSPKRPRSGWIHHVR